MDVQIRKTVEVELTVNLEELGSIIHLIGAALSIVPDGGTSEEQALHHYLLQIEKEALR